MIRSSIARRCFDGIGAVRVEREVSLNDQHVVERILVRPGDILGRATSRAEIACVAFIRAVSAGVAWAEFAHRDVGARDVVDRIETRLLQDEGVAAVGEDGIIQLDHNPLPRRSDGDRMVWTWFSSTLHVVFLPVRPPRKFRAVLTLIGVHPGVRPTASR